MAGQFACLLEDLVLFGILEGFRGDVEVALREFEDAPVAVAFAPDLQERAGEAACLGLVFAVADDVFAALFEFGGHLVVDVEPVLVAVEFAQNQPLLAIRLLEVEVHQAVAVGVGLLLEPFDERVDRPLCVLELVASAWPDCGDRLHVAWDSGVDVEVEEEGLAAPGECVLAAVEDQFLRDLLEVLVIHAHQVWRVEDVDVCDAEGAGVVCLH